GGIACRDDDDQDDQTIEEGDRQAHDSTLPRPGVFSRLTVGSGANLSSSATLVTSVNAMPATSALVPAGTKACLKPSLAASFSRFSACGTGRMSPDREISPKNTVSRGKDSPPKDETSAAAAARSAAGSPIF